MIVYLPSSSLVPVFDVADEGGPRRGKDRSASCRSYSRYLGVILRFRWPLVLGYLAGAAVLLVILLPHMGTEIFPDLDAAILRMRLRAPAGTRVEETERQVLRALDAIDREIGPENIAITSDFVGVVPSSYPVNLIHLFTSGSHEAVIQIALKAGAPRGEPLREKLRARLREEFPDLQVCSKRRHRQPSDELQLTDAD
jgi:multidrug efflux pump subunit AcrB